MLLERDEAGRDGEMKALLKEKEDKRKCGPLYKSNIIFCADNGRQEEAIEESQNLQHQMQRMLVYTRIGGKEFMCSSRGGGGT